MITTKNPELKSEIKHRLARIEGQLRGVQKMIDEERDCKEIVQQLIAIRSGVQSASLQFIREVANDCLADFAQNENPASRRAHLDEVIQMLGKVS